jgi:hypothetical protein
MAYTYSDNPVIGGTAEQQRDAVRFLTQDNQPNAANNFRITDEEIAFLLATEANEFMAAARGCEILSTRIGAVTRKRVGTLDLTFSTADYKAQAVALRTRGMTYQTPYIGGISKSDKQSLQLDTDWMQPLFARAMQENPGSTTAILPINDYGQDP